MKKLALVLIISFLGWGNLPQGICQEIGFSAFLGPAIPNAEFKSTQERPEESGFAKLGFDMSLGIERFFNKKWVVGANAGYSVYSLDIDALKKVVNPQNPELVDVKSENFQNMTLLAIFGYQFTLVPNKWYLQPNIDAGLGFFTSAYYQLTNPAGSNVYQILRVGNTTSSILLSPNIKARYQVNPFTSIALKVAYQLANYSVNEELQITPSAGSSPSVDKTTVDHAFRSANIGLGVTFTFL